VLCCSRLFLLLFFLLSFWKAYSHLTTYVI
jgi:hypothetical protein